MLNLNNNSKITKKLISLFLLIVGIFLVFFSYLINTFETLVIGVSLIFLSYYIQEE